MVNPSAVAKFNLFITSGVLSNSLNLILNISGVYLSNKVAYFSGTVKCDGTAVALVSPNKLNF